MRGQSLNFANKRRFIRFKPDQDTYARVLMPPHAIPYDAYPEFLAITVNESAGGCGLVSMSAPHLQVGLKVHVQVGELPLVRSQIVWVRHLDDEICRFGIQYLE